MATLKARLLAELTTMHLICGSPGETSSSSAWCIRQDRFTIRTDR
ncbi:MAG: hypothetical protein ABI434_12415 [Burkholderiaceae bacterium]